MVFFKEFLLNPKLNVGRPGESLEEFIHPNFAFFRSRLNWEYFEDLLKNTI